MKKYKIIPLLFIAALFLLAGFKKQNGNIKIPEDKSGGIVSTKVDTMPNICTVLPAEEIDALHIFNNRLTKSYPEQDPIENFHSCYYEFYKPNDFPMLSVQLVKYLSKQEAGSVFHQNVLDHYDTWGVDPERILHVGDSAFFGLNTNAYNKCDECSLIVNQGVYMVYVNFKGQMDEVPRERKKTIAITIVQRMYDRIPALAPSFIRSKGG
jgi:hypothetical protein